MSIYRTTSIPASRQQPLTINTPVANASRTPFVRPHRDSAPAPNVAGRGWTNIDPLASADEKMFFSRASEVAGIEDLSKLRVRFTQIVQAECAGNSRLEEFMFEKEPANVRVVYPRVVINVGSDDKGTAGQLSMVNGRIETAKGAVMQDPKVQALAIQHAALALCLGVARQKETMPYAVTALQELQNAMQFRTLYD
ncbi:hypothetical protein ACSFA3_08020 [Variovorax sp. RHLX14]|uniref:hypothetical protein n=1 Tax=Variovorax sp. RHLX14 TaxID=1259731 RepID=UPI003F472D94